MKEIAKGILYIGTDDTQLDLFESQYVVPEGMAYNSYLIKDEKYAVLDTVDRRKGEDWLRNLKEALEGRAPDYLVVHHMEPDHSALIGELAALYPQMQIVASAKAIQLLGQFQPGQCFNTLAVKEGDSLSLGTCQLRFFAAPMVHWPEVIVTYDDADKVLFSADGFGKFGALDVEDPEGWACEARRYYFGIVGKYGAQVQALLKKASALDIQTICPTHGPVLTENLGYYLDLYNTWSSYGVESEGVVIAYTSVYGHTKAAAELLAKKLADRGCPKVSLTDLARDDMPEAVEDAFRYGTLVLASTTYNAEVFPPMREFINHLAERGYKNRTVAFIENGSWAPTAAKVMKGLLEGCKGLSFAEPTVRILSALNDESEAQLDALADALCRN